MIIADILNQSKALSKGETEMKKICLIASHCLKYALFIWIAAGGCYDLYFNGINDYVDDLSFIIAYFVFCAAFRFLTDRNKEILKSDWGKTAVNVIMIEMFFVVLFSQEHLILSIAVLLGIALGYLCIYRSVIAESVQENASFRKKQKERLQLFICSFAALVLIVPSGIGAYEEYIDTALTADEWSIFVEVFKENSSDNIEESLFEKHRQTLLDIKQWNSMNNKEKTELIYKIGLIELENLGVSERVGIKIQAEKIDEYTLGYYQDSQKQIIINEQHIFYGDVEENIRTISHEAFHAYQHYVVDSFNFDSEFVQNSAYCEDARIWKDNIDNYIPAELDFEGYQSQPLEADADTYARQRAKEYMLAIS